MENCKKCGVALEDTRKRLCPDCKEVMKKIHAEKAALRKRNRYKEKIGGRYTYNKGHGTAGKKETEKLVPNTKAWDEATPYQRMAAMGLSAVMVECKLRGITYKIAQNMYYGRTLPDDFGLMVSTG